ncbi:MAG TPA: TonB family protein [Blastocatellia bacterium]
MGKNRAYGVYKMPDESKLGGLRIIDGTVVREMVLPYTSRARGVIMIAVWALFMGFLALDRFGGRSGRGSRAMDVFGILVAILVTGFFAFAIALDKRTITVSDSTLSVKLGPIPFLASSVSNIADVEQVYCGSYHVPRAGKLYQVVALLKDGKKALVAGDIAEERVAQTVAWQLLRWLDEVQRCIPAAAHLCGARTVLSNDSVRIREDPVRVALVLACIVGGLVVFGGSMALISLFSETPSEKLEGAERVIGGGDLPAPDAGGRGQVRLAAPGKAASLDSGTMDWSRYPALDESTIRARATHQKIPDYPSLAFARAQGEVTVAILIGEDGSVEAAEAQRGPPLLRAGAEQAARGWRFNPVLVHGGPAKVRSCLTFQFSFGK